MKVGIDFSELLGLTASVDCIDGGVEDGGVGTDTGADEDVVVDDDDDDDDDEDEDESFSASLLDEEVLDDEDALEDMKNDLTFCMNDLLCFFSCAVSGGGVAGTVDTDWMVAGGIRGSSFTDNIFNVGASCKDALGK
jgi:hypothetical protein